jgi:DNA (cytosine-5)-methyltransferase 1
VLSLFPGIGLLDMAFEEAGFCIVRGPDLLWGGDVSSFHPPRGRFDGIIGGPPCQAFSRLRHIVEANGYQTAPNLIPEFERVVAEAEPTWFLMENVPDAPLPICKYGDRYYPNKPVMIRDVWVGGETDRLRRFTFGCKYGADQFNVETLALHRPDPEHSALASGGGRPVPVAVGGSGKRKISAKSALKNYGYKTGDAFAAHLRKQGLPSDFLDASPFTVAGKIKVVGNGVPLPMGKAVANAVKRAINVAKIEAS